MRPRTLLVLFAVVAALLAFIWLYERKLPSSEERADLAKRVLRFEPTEVRSLDIAWAGQSVRLEREPAADEDDAQQPAGNWWLRQPIEARADEAKVDGLLFSLANLETERTLEDVGAEEVGLDSPRAFVTVTTIDGTSSLAVGAEVPATERMIVARNDEAPYFVVSKFVWDDLTIEPGDWRSRRLVDVSRDDVERISIARAKENLSLARRGDDFWLEAPLVDRADAENTSSLLTELLNLQVDTFIDDPPSSDVTGLGADAVAIDLLFSGGTPPLRIELGGAGDDPAARYARVGGQVVTVNTELADALERSAEEWRSKAWAALETYQIDEGRVMARDGEIAVRREGGDWLRDGERVPYDAVSDFLYAVAATEAQRFSGDVAPDLEPILEIELVGKDGTSDSLALYPLQGGEYPARVEGRAATLWLADNAVRPLLEKLEILRTAEPIDVDEEAGASPGAE